MLKHTLHSIHHPKPQHEYAKKYIQCNIPNSSPKDILNKITAHSQSTRFLWIHKTIYLKIIRGKLLYSALLYL